MKSGISWGYASHGAICMGLALCAGAWGLNVGGCFEQLKIGGMK